jgi:hypothetical protein
MRFYGHRVRCKWQADRESFHSGHWRIADKFRKGDPIRQAIKVELSRAE